MFSYWVLKPCRWPIFLFTVKCSWVFLTSGVTLDVGGAPGSFGFHFLSSATYWNRSGPFWLGFPWQHWGCFILCWLFSLYNIPRDQPLGLHDFFDQRDRLLTRVVEPFERWLVVSSLWPNWAFKIWTQLLAVLLVPCPHKPSSFDSWIQKRRVTVVLMYKSCYKIKYSFTKTVGLSLFPSSLPYNISTSCLIWGYRVKLLVLLSDTRI